MKRFVGFISNTYGDRITPRSRPNEIKNNVQNNIVKS
jgi:hypothetical protein